MTIHAKFREWADYLAATVLVILVALAIWLPLGYLFAKLMPK